MPGVGIQCPGRKPKRRIESPPANFERSSNGWTLGSGPRNWGFESLPLSLCGYSSTVEHYFAKVKVEGSNPSIRSGDC